VNSFNPHSAVQPMSTAGATLIIFVQHRCLFHKAGLQKSSSNSLQLFWIIAFGLLILVIIIGDINLSRVFYERE